MVENVRPPITATPIGRHISEPSPLPIAIGTMPRMVVSVVITTGRRRERPPSITARRIDMPRSRFSVM